MMTEMISRATRFETTLEVAFDLKREFLLGRRRDLLKN